MTAAVTDPYAVALDYRARVGKTGTGSDTDILAQLTAVSRYLDLRLRRFFTQDAAVVTRLYDGNGEARLWLPDDIATSTGLVVTVDLDGDYSFADETALTIDTDFWLGPENADKGSEPRPWEYLDVHPSSGQLSIWPDQQRAIQVTAKFGWPAVPAAIKEATISITRQLRDMEESGMTYALQEIDTVVNQSREMSALLWRLQQVYAKPSKF
ncbi:MAG: hypothetical protein A2Z17_06870 [Gammaproteobacteria bacterium RBG_16_66_13]|nr:MAG: hypothetical protein A2Z17_06870 [Gammaproteobacteria bacterium RBG_16_66_13]